MCTNRSPAEKSFEEKYEELKGLLQKILYSGGVTPGSKALMIQHGLMEIPFVDPVTLSRTHKIMQRLNEPMRDEELGIEARKEIPVMASALLKVSGVVKAAVLWRAQGINPSTEIERALAAQVDILLTKK